MPNKDLKDNQYNTGSDGEKEKYTALAMQESRLNKAKEVGKETGDWSEFTRLGGEVELKRLENLIHTAQNANYSVKRTGMQAGRENQFIKSHTKDKDNANPTGVGGIPKLHKGSVNDKIMSNREVYNESIIKEISEMKYLMEYMDNNKKLKK